MEQISLWWQQLLASIDEAIQNLVAFLPSLLIAVAVVLAGWVIAVICRWAATRAAGRIDAFFDNDSEEKQRRAFSSVLGTLVFWTILISFFTVALGNLELAVIDEWTEQALEYLPVFIGGVLIIVLGFITGNFARLLIEPAVASMGIAHEEIIARLSQIVIIVTAIVIGTGHLGIDVSFITLISAVLVGVLLSGMVLTIALGTREQLSNLIGVRYARKHFQVGDIVQTKDIQGRLIKIEDGCIFLETENGDVSVPGQLFTQQPFTKVQAMPNER